MPSIFTIFFGGIIAISTRLTDYMNRVLFSIKGLAVLLAISLLLTHVHPSYYTQVPLHQSMYMPLLLPVFLTAFGFHTAIPSMINYCNSDEKVIKRMVFITATVSFIIYVLWLLTVFGSVPYHGNHGLRYLNHVGGGINELMGLLFYATRLHSVLAALNIFAHLALLTSFLGVCIGLFDFIRDALSIKNNVKGRLITFCITFIPPWIFAVYYPQGFLFALSVAGLLVAILELILPALMRRSLAKIYKQQGKYTLSRWQRLWLWGVFSFGVAIVVIEVLMQFHVLPHF
jgi:tyrosine-specific transport protein